MINNKVKKIINRMKAENMAKIMIKKRTKKRTKKITKKITKKKAIESITTLIIKVVTPIWMLMKITPTQKD